MSSESEFKSFFCTARNINDMWFELLNNLWEKGRKYLITSGSFKGSYRLEFDYVAGTILKPTERPLAVYTPPGIPTPTTDDAIINYFVNYLMNGKLEKNEHYKYSSWIVGGQYIIPEITINNKKIEKAEISIPNQLQWCIDHFKTNGFGNNHCLIQIGYPETNLGYDIPYENEADRWTSPCLRLIDLKIIKTDNYKLCMNVYFRSWDLYSGFPENIGGLALLMEYISDNLSDPENNTIVEPGPLSFASKGLHCYDFQIECVKAKLNKS